MAYNSIIDKDTDDILIYGNTAKDGSGTDYVPLLDADGQLQVDVVASGLPTGASTLAEQQSQTTHLATIAGDTTAIETAVQLIDDTVYSDGAGTVTKGIAILGQDGTNPQAIKTDASGELQVDVLTMPTVTVTATNLDVQSGGADLATTTQAGAIQTAVELIDDVVVAQGTALGTTKTVLDGASVTTAAPTYTTGQISPLNQTTSGALRVDVGATSANATAIKVNVASAGIASGAIASGAIASGAIASGAIASGAVASGAIASGAIAAGAIAAGATSIADNEDVARAAADRLVKVAQVRVDAPPSGANVSGTEDYTQFIADLYGKTWVAGSVTEDVAHAAGESIMGSGVRRIDTPASSAGSSGDWATMDASAEGALWTTNAATTTGGVTVANFNTGDTFTALTNTAQVIKASAGNFYGYYIYNPNATATYVMLYNVAAASVTVGTTTPFMVFCIPATAGANLSLATPITFTNAGWSIAAATTGGGNSAPATALEAMIWYK